MLEFGATELNSTFETTAVLLPGQIDSSSARQYHDVWNRPKVRKELW